MKTLLLLRHAKSDWENPNLSDFERPLNQRGLKTAPLMGKFIREKGLKIDLIISSPATRAHETARLVSEKAKLKADTRFDERIYEASVGQLLQVVSETEDQVESLLMVGHNPGFSGLLQLLTREFYNMPTAALAKINLDIKTWAEIRPGDGKLEFLQRPKEL
jgi:phosphohistidine phosphatase